MLWSMGERQSAPQSFPWPAPIRRANRADAFCAPATLGSRDILAFPNAKAIGHDRMSFAEG
jgi:hypothetical protein